MRLLSVLLLAACSLFGQSYDYFGEVGGACCGPSSITGFGIRGGGSNFFLAVDVKTTFQNGKTSSTLEPGTEYHVAMSGRWEFIGLVKTGVTVVTSNTNLVTSSATLANFNGGAGVSYDAGRWFTRMKPIEKQISLPVVFLFKIGALTNGDQVTVKPEYWITFRKTF